MYIYIYIYTYIYIYSSHWCSDYLAATGGRISEHNFVPFT